jgi:hypothetical protein
MITAIREHGERKQSLCFSSDKRKLIVSAAIMVIFFFSIINEWEFNTTSTATNGTTTSISVDKAVSSTASESESESSWNKAIKEAEQELLEFDFDYDFNSESDNDNDYNNTHSKNRAITPSCLLPDNKGMDKLMKKLLTDADDDRQRQNVTHTNTKKSNMLLPLPVLNMGMPKAGSLSLYNYFKCIGVKTTHHANNQDEYEGICMRDAARVGFPPLKTCAPQMDALMQMDITNPFGFGVGGRVRRELMSTHKKRDECFFPQLSLLEEIHQESPQATFIINFRPIYDWIKSVEGWHGMLLRFSNCHLPNLPFDVPSRLLVNQKKRGNSTAKVVVDQIMIQFFCSHVIHLRNFVNQYPSHTLIELDLYDTNKTQYVLNTIFQTQQQPKVCWNQANKSNGTRKKEYINNTSKAA